MPVQSPNQFGGTKKQQSDLPTFKPFVYRNFSGGTVRRIGNEVASSSSVRLSLNMDSDVEIGSLVSRLGTTLLGSQAIAGASCLGIGNYVRTSLVGFHSLDEDGDYVLNEDGTKVYTEDSGKKLFAVFPTDNDNTIYDILDGTDNLTGDSQGRKTRFCTFLDSIVRVNGVDSPKAYNSNEWLTTGGAFDLANMPLFNIVIEWQDRVYGVISDSDNLQFSSIADYSTNTVNWTTSATDPSAAGNLYVSREDGGGVITALEKVPGYLIIFKQLSMKRWDGSSTFPEDLVKQGVLYQECVTRARELCYFINQKGIWTTNGSYPIRISRSVQDFVEAITDFSKVSCVADDIHVYFSIGDVTVGRDTYTNCVLKYNIEEQTWNIRTYANKLTAMSRYQSNTATNYLVAGDNDGNILTVDSGFTDYPDYPINWSVETQQLDWGNRGNVKEIQKMITYTENISTGKALWRNTNNPDDYDSFGNINQEVSELKNPKKSVRGNYFGFKFTGTINTQQVKFLGYEFPINSIIYTQNANV